MPQKLIASQKGLAMMDLVTMVLE